MRILAASGIFHPDSGGPATYLYRLLPELQAKGHTVHALAYGNAPSADYPYPLTRIPFRKNPLSNLVLRMAGYALAYREQAHQSDLIYLNSLGLPRSGDSRKPRVMKVVGDYAWERSVNKGLIPATEDIDDFQKRQYSPLVEWFKRSRAHEVQTMDHVIVPSEYLRQMVIGWGAKPDRVQVIYNALDTQAFTVDLPRRQVQEKARAVLGWLNTGHYIFTAARLTAWKGVDYLIDALVAVPDVILVIAGDGPQLEALKTRAQNHNVADRVLFLGKIAHDTISNYMQAADYLILYSGYEGLSHTILEALYSGTPVIASRRGGNPEIVQDGVNGLLVKHPDVDALIAVLRQAFEGDLPLNLAAGTSQGLGRFDWSRLVEQTVQALVEVHISCTS